jgi:putative tributyrin esterase
MKRFPSAASLTLIFTAALGAAPALAADSTVDYIEVESKSLKRKVEVGVYLPAGYADAANAGRRYPVIYFLHGMFGTARKWEDRGTAEIIDALIADAKIPPTIVISPDGARSSFWMKWADGSQDWEAFVVGELVAAIDDRYRTLADRATRGITGDSMGGLGALNLAFRNPDVFSSVSAHSAAILPADPYQSPERMQRSGASRFKPIFGDPIDLEHWKQWNPLCLAESYEKERLSRLAIYFDCGEADRYGFDEGARALHELLTKKGVAHESHIRPGNHGADYYIQYVDRSLSFHAAAFAKATAKKTAKDAGAPEGGGTDEDPAKRDSAKAPPRNL